MINLPKVPPKELLWSMTMRIRHNFGLTKQPGSCTSGVTEQEREQISQDMRRVYDEVAGAGFFVWQPHHLKGE